MLFLGGKEGKSRTSAGYRQPPAFCNMRLVAWLGKKSFLASKRRQWFFCFFAAFEKDWSSILADRVLPPPPANITSQVTSQNVAPPLHSDGGSEVPWPLWPNLCFVFSLLSERTDAELVCPHGNLNPKKKSREKFFQMKAGFGWNTRLWMIRSKGWVKFQQKIDFAFTLVERIRLCYDSWTNETELEHSEGGLWPISTQWWVGAGEGGVHSHAVFRWQGSNWIKIYFIASTLQMNLSQSMGGSIWVDPQLQTKSK